MHCVASRFGYPNYRWSQLVRIIDVLLYFHHNCCSSLPYIHDVYQFTGTEHKALRHSTTAGYQYERVRVILLTGRIWIWLQEF